MVSASAMYDQRATVPAKRLGILVPVGKQLVARVAQQPRQRLLSK